MQPVIYAADIGSIAQGNFGWARVDPEQGDTQVERGHGGSEIAELVEAVARDLGEGRPVALGFECPLFVPVPRDSRKLGKARVGEGSRSFSAGAGTGALVTGLVQSAWVLRSLRERCPDTVAFLDWAAFAAAGRGLFLWEAFVSGGVKGTSHVDDAQIAAAAFRDALPNPWAANAITAAAPLSLIGAAMVWSGWSPDLALLHEPCLVIKAGMPGEAVEPADAADGLPAQDLAPAAKSSEHLNDWVVRVAEQIPEGRWTTYGAVAEIITDDPETSLRPAAISVGTTLGRDATIPNAHRILKQGGKFPDMYPYPPELIRGEGVRFPKGRADPKQRWPTPGP